MLGAADMILLGLAVGVPLALRWLLFAAIDGRRERTLKHAMERARRRRRVYG